MFDTRVDLPAPSPADPRSQSFPQLVVAEPNRSTQPITTGRCGFRGRL